jgi:uncharacterized GH25 family protein
MIMRKTMLLFLLISMVSFLARAHEFWMEASNFYFKAAETANINFRVGENFIGEGWKVNSDRVRRLEHYSGKQLKDLKQGLERNTSGPFPVSLGNEGGHLIAMETDAAFIRLDGEKFTEYLEEDGLDDVLFQRRKERISSDSASEFYSRHTKLILQAGSRTDDTYKKICNLPIEIIPDENPALLKKGDRIGFTILFEGKPLFGAKVKVWNRHNHSTSVQNIFSQQDGKIETHVSNPGAWMVSVIKMVPSKDTKAQYRSYWGTLVFGVR